MKLARENHVPPAAIVADVSIVVVATILAEEAAEDPADSLLKNSIQQFCALSLKRQ
jgi:hypothetical protein